MSNLKMIGYPRSGNNFYQNRITLFMQKCQNQVLSTLETAQMINPGHLGFDCHSGLNNFNACSYEISQIAKDTILTVCLRNPKAILSSYYVYLKHNRFPLLGIPIPSCFSSMYSFTVSAWGVPRLCKFLNLLPQLGEFNTVFYEDNTKIESVLSIPKNLGIIHNFTQEEIDWIISNSDISRLKHGLISDDIRGDVRNELLNIGPKERSRKGTVDSYKKDMSIESQNYIDSFLQSNCYLNFYLERYLK